MNSYAERDSLTPWINSLPEDWHCTRIDNVAEVLFSNVDKHTIDDEEPVRLCNYIDVYKNGRITQKLEFMEASAEKREIQKFQVQRGDVLSTKDSETPDDIAISALVDDDLPGVLCGYHLALMRPRSKNLYGPYLAWVHSSKQFRAQYEARAVGVTRFGLPQYAFKAARLPLPPLPEQKRIAAYLDVSCAAIDAAVAAKRRQIETLDAIRIETIHHAVSEGLNPAIKLKSSNIRWFDKIPAHWEIERLKDLVGTNPDAIKVGPFGSDLLLGDMADKGVKVYNQRTVIDRDFESGNHFISEEKYAEMRAFTVFPGDLLITTRGTIGRCAIVPPAAQRGILHPCLMRVQANKRRMLPEYLALLVQDGGFVLRQLEMMSAATTIDVVYSGSLKRTYLPVPPVNEQLDILNLINEKTGALDRITESINRQIRALSAYRRSLIHECITGLRRVTDEDVERAEAQWPSARNLQN